VPYEKGYFFLCALEAVVGRAGVRRLAAQLPGRLPVRRRSPPTTSARTSRPRTPALLAKVDADRWIDGPGMPADAEAPLGAPRRVLAVATGVVPSAEATAGWAATEWQLVLELVPRPAEPATCRALDDAFHLTASTNYDVLVTWLTLALDAGDRAVLDRVEQVLGAVGRMKYLRPLYAGLVRDPDTGRGRSRPWRGAAPATTRSRGRWSRAWSAPGEPQPDRRRRYDAERRAGRGGVVVARPITGASTSPRRSSWRR
jgi:leukotriene-A4 hydrolase